MSARLTGPLFYERVYCQLLSQKSKFILGGAYDVFMSKKYGHTSPAWLGTGMSGYAVNLIKEMYPNADHLELRHVSIGNLTRHHVLIWKDNRHIGNGKLYLIDPCYKTMFINQDEPRNTEYAEYLFEYTPSVLVCELDKVHEITQKLLHKKSQDPNHIHEPFNNLYGKIDHEYYKLLKQTKYHMYISNNNLNTYIE